MARRWTAWWACIPTVALLVGGCSSQAPFRPTATHRPVPSPHGSATTSPPAPATTAPPSAVPTTVPAPVRQAPGWAEHLTTLSPGGGFTSVSCLSDTFCIAVGGGTSGDPSELTVGSGVTESWDGAAWSLPSVYDPAPAEGPVTGPVLPAIDCTDGPLCVITDGSLHLTSGNGTDWATTVPMPSAPVLVPNPDDPGSGHPESRSADVSCPSPGFCAFVDNTGQAFVLEHDSWLTPQSFGVPGGSGTPVSLYQAGRVGVSCPTTSSCTAVVGSSVLTWNGSAWAEAPAPWTSSVVSGPSDPTAISCPTTSLCAVVNGTGVVMGWPGGAWSADQSIDPQGGLDSISCPTATFCVAADETGSVVTWNGMAWSLPVQVIPNATEYPALGTSVSCPTAQFCLVINGDGDYATYSGSSFP